MRGMVLQHASHFWLQGPEDTVYNMSMDTYFKELLTAALIQRGWFVTKVYPIFWVLPDYRPPGLTADELPDWAEHGIEGCLVKTISDAVRIELYREAHE